MATPIIEITHEGPCDAHSRSNRVLRFFETYATTAVDGKNLTGDPTQFYSRDCRFTNCNSAVYVGSDKIWAWMQGLFGDFSKIEHIASHMRVVRERDTPSPVWTLYADTIGYFTIRGRESEGPVLLPRCFRWTVGEAEGGAEGLNFMEAKLWWDTGLLAGKMPQDAVAFRKHAPS